MASLAPARAKADAGDVAKADKYMDSVTNPIKRTLRKTNLER